jgi:Leucine-rich repeat (LRR) protein
VKLNKEDCDAWKEVVHPGAYFLKAPTPICSEPRHYLDPCSCDALLCSDRGEKIVGLELGKKGLTANVSADDSLGLLVNLQHLDLQQNSLEGFPTWVSKLTSLTNLSMWSNRLSGNIDAVAKLRKLEYLALGDNANLTFQIDAVAELSSLSFLSLVDTNVSGTLDGVKELTSLKHLHLRQHTGVYPAPGCGKKENATKGQTCCASCEVHCPGQCAPGKCSCAVGEYYATATAHPGLTGSLGPLSKLTSLVWVSADGNRLSGSLGPLSTLKSLATLSLSQNFGLYGSLDPLRGLTNLTFLDVGANKLTGPVDPLYNLRSLRILSVAYNRLTGILDSGFRSTNMPNLTKFNAGTNMFTAVPSNNVEWSRFTDGCFLHRENFTCSADTPLPPAAKRNCGATCCVGSSADLVAGDCDAWRNFTQDQLYKEWAEGKCGAKVHTDPCSCIFHNKVVCTDGRITTLDMGQQDMPSGGLPVALMDLTGLEFLSLPDNQLDGSIPSTIGQLTKLTFLQLYGSYLGGSIPSTIGKLTGLTSLNLRSNNFTGHVPTELKQLKQLTSLILDHNNLVGPLPPFNFAQYTACCRMQDVSFTCPLPAGAGTCVGGGDHNTCGGKLPPPTCIPPFNGSSPALVAGDYR